MEEYMRLGFVRAAALGLVLSLSGVAAAHANNQAPFNTSGLRAFVSQDYTDAYGRPDVVALTGDITDATAGISGVKVYVAFLKQPADVASGGFEQAANVQQHWQFQGIAPRDYVLVTLSRGGSVKANGPLKASSDDRNTWMVGVAVGDDLTGFAPDPAKDSVLGLLAQYNKTRFGFKDGVATGDLSELIKALAGDNAHVIDDRAHQRDGEVQALVSLRAAQAAAADEPVATTAPSRTVDQHHVNYDWVLWLALCLFVAGLFAPTAWRRWRNR
jgi:hypothetical protein